MNEKKKLPLPILILIIFVCVGLVFAAVGLVKQVGAKKTNEERKNASVKAAKERVDAAKKRLAEIEKELAPLNESYEAKNQECDSMNMTAPGWFENHSKCQREATKINTQINELEMEKEELQNADYNAYYVPVKPMSYIIFYIIGGSVALLGAIAAFIIYLIKGKKTY